MDQIQFKIQFREIAIMLGVICLIITIEFEYFYIQWSISAYLMWNVFRIITHIANKFKKKR